MAQEKIFSQCSTLLRTRHITLQCSIYCIEGAQTHYTRYCIGEDSYIVKYQRLDTLHKYIAQEKILSQCSITGQTHYTSMLHRSSYIVQFYRLDIQHNYIYCLGGDSFIVQYYRLDTLHQYIAQEEILTLCSITGQTHCTSILHRRSVVNSTVLQVRHIATVYCIGDANQCIGQKEIHTFYNITVYEFYRRRFLILQY